MKDGKTYNSINYLLIEDEYYARQELKAIMASIRPEYHCAGEVEGVTDAVKFLSDNDVDLILADICVCDGFSPDAFRITGCHTPVIVTTGYEQYRDQLGHMNVVAYLLKPVTPEMLNEGVATFEKNQLIYSH